MITAGGKPLKWLISLLKIRRSLETGLGIAHDVLMIFRDLTKELWMHRP